MSEFKEDWYDFYMTVSERAKLHNFFTVFKLFFVCVCEGYVGKAICVG